MNHNITTAVVVDLNTYINQHNQYTIILKNKPFVRVTFDFGIIN